MAEFLWILAGCALDALVEVVVERTQCNASAARIGGLALQSVEQVSHQSAVPALHLLARETPGSSASQNHPSLLARQGLQRATKKNLVRARPLLPAGTGVLDIQQRKNIGRTRIAQIVVDQRGNVQARSRSVRAGAIQSQVAIARCRIEEGMPGEIEQHQRILPRTHQAEIAQLALNLVTRRLLARQVDH